MYGKHRFLYENAISSADMIYAPTVSPGIVSGTQKTGYGSASLVATGQYSGTADRVVLVQIDDTTAGVSIGQATYRWRYLDMSPGVWGASGVTTSSTAQMIDEGIYIRFASSGVGNDFAEGDEWRFNVLATWSAKNLIDLRRDTSYRSGVVDGHKTLTIDFGASTRIQAVCLYDHNITADDTITLMMNASDSWTSPSFSLPLTVSDPIVEYFDNTARYLRIDVYNASEPEKELIIGLMYAGAYMELEFNAIWGSSESLAFKAQGNENPAGVINTAIYSEQSSLTLPFRIVSNSDMTKLQAMFRAVNLPNSRQLKPIFFHLFNDEPETMKLMRLEPTLPRTYEGYPYNSVTLSLREIVAPNTETVVSTRGGVSSAYAANAVTTDTTDFDGILSTADTTVQKALDTLDDHIHVVTADVTYYVATTGSDTTGDGSSGAPWATPSKALSMLGHLRVLEGKTLTIQCDDGTYTLTSSITNLPKGFLLTGKNTYTKTMSSVQSSSGSAGAYSIVINVNTVTNVTTSDYCIILAATGGTTPNYLVGCHAITNVDAVNNRLTITSKNQLGVPSGAVSASVTILKTVMSFTGCSGLSNCNGTVSKIAVIGNSTAGTAAIYQNQAAQQTVTTCGLSGFENGLLCYGGQQILCSQTGISGMSYGAFLTITGYIRLTSTAISGSTVYAVYVADNSILFSDTAAIIAGNAVGVVATRTAKCILGASCAITETAAAYADRLAYIYLVGVSVTGTLSPAANTQGNEYAYIDN